MNKKVLSAILFSALFACTGTFTSCIDNDEPAGIEELRGAKAELLRAKVAVEQAQAALVLAQAEVEKAEAEKVLAEAEIKKAVAAIKEAEAKKQEIENESIAADLELTIAKNQMLLDSLQLKHQVIMTNLNTSLAESQRKYEEALAKIAVVKELFPLETIEGFQLSILATNVKNAEGAVAKADSVVKAKQAVYDTALIKKQYLGVVETSELEATVDTAEIDLAEAKALLAEMEGWLEEDALTKDWRAEVDKLNAKVDSLEKIKASVDAQVTLAENSEEYKALEQAVKDADKLADVDSAYYYTYVGVNNTAAALENTTYRLYGIKDAVTGKVSSTVFDKDFAETNNADSLAAQVDKTVIGEIATYDANNVLTSGKLYNDKKYLASFTTEVKAFLDTIAAGAEVDTSYLADIKAWSDTLAIYKGLDTKTDFATLKTKAGNALTKYFDKEAKAKTVADSLLAYYNAAEKNGLTLGNVPVKNFTVDGTGKVTTSYALEGLKAVLDDTIKTAFILDSVYKSSDPFFAVGKTEATYNGKKYKKDGVLTKDALDATSCLKALVRCSDKAFGEADNYLTDFGNFENMTNMQNGYLHTQPSEADMKTLYTYYGLKAISNGVLGSYGKYLFTTDEANIVFAKNYKTIMANYEGAIAYWEAKYTILKAKLDAWNKAKDATKLAFNKYKYENVYKLSEKADEIKGEIDGIEPIVGALDNLIKVYLPVWASNLANYSAAEDAFMTGLENIIKKQQANVRVKEKTLANAKIALELSKQDSYTAFNKAEAELNAAMEALEEAQAELDKALADYARALEIIAELNAAE